MKRLPNLDVLRFFLSVYVIMIHLAQFSANQGLPNYNHIIGKHKGNQAIAMFFVLSGFLIIRIIYRAKQKDRFSISRFYMRRILKIFPLYYFVVILGFLYYHVLLPAVGIPVEINYDLKDGIFLNVFFLANIFTRSYDVGGALGVLWSIAIEEQFYIIIAPFLFFLRKSRIFQALLALTLVYFIVFHLNGMQVLRKFKFEFFFIFSGGLIAILGEMGKLEFLKRTKWVSILSILGVILYFFTPIFDFEVIWIYNLFTCVLFSVFIHSICLNNFGVEIKNKSLNYFGEISYGLYLYHIFAINFVAFMFLKLKPLQIFNDTITLILLNVLTYGLTIFVSHLSYKYFESYFLKMKNKFR